jgi:hypothetical protein
MMAPQKENYGRQGIVEQFERSQRAQVQNRHLGHPGRSHRLKPVLQNLAAKTDLWLPGEEAAQDGEHHKEQNADHEVTKNQARLDFLGEV